MNNEEPEEPPKPEPDGEYFHNPGTVIPPAAQALEALLVTVRGYAMPHYFRTEDHAKIHAKSGRDASAARADELRTALRNGSGTFTVEGFKITIEPAEEPLPIPEPRRAGSRSGTPATRPYRVFNNRNPAPKPSRNFPPPEDPQERALWEAVPLTNQEATDAEARNRDAAYYPHYAGNTVEVYVPALPACAAQNIVFVNHTVPAGTPLYAVAKYRNSGYVLYGISGRWKGHRFTTVPEDVTILDHCLPESEQTTDAKTNPSAAPG